MEHLLNTITWKQYLGTILTAVSLYYAFIAWKYYRSEIRLLVNRVSSKNENIKELPDVLQYEEANHVQTGEKAKTVVQEPQTYPQELPFSGKANDLARQLRQCIDDAAEESFAPQLLIPKLQKILNDYPDVAPTKDRENINALVVSECENTGTALLSESEVDQWWSA